MLEPDETIGAKAVESAETETPPAVLDTRLDSTPQADPEPSVGPSAILETDTAPAACSAPASSLLLADQMEPAAPDDSPEVETTSQSSNPDPGSLETLVASWSPVPYLYPAEGPDRTREPERYAPVHRLQVLPVNQAQAGPSVWLFPTIGIA